MHSAIVADFAAQCTYRSELLSVLFGTLRMRSPLTFDQETHLQGLPVYQSLKLKMGKPEGKMIGETAVPFRDISMIYQKFGSHLVSCYHSHIQLRKKHNLQYTLCKILPTEQLASNKIGRHGSFHNSQIHPCAIPFPLFRCVQFSSSPPLDA
jgi:hypothetical protein